MKRAILPVVAAVAAILGMISVARTRTKHEATVPPSAPPASSFEQVVAGVGLVEANSENIDVSCAVSGMVTQLYVRAGDRVGHEQRPQRAAPELQHGGGGVFDVELADGVARRRVHRLDIAAQHAQAVDVVDRVDQNRAAARLAPPGDVEIVLRLVAEP